MSEDGAALLERLRSLVAERRASGEYPPNLEEDLDAHFHRILASRSQMPLLAILRRKIESARRASRFSPERIPTSTRLPGGSALHRTLSRLFLRQTIGILEQVQEFADRTLEALDGAAALAESPDNHRHGDLIEQADVQAEQLARLIASGGAPDADADSLADIGRRLGRLEQAEAARQWRPWFGRDRFDSAFDGGRQESLTKLIGSAIGDRQPVFELSGSQDGRSLATLARFADCGLGGVVATRADEVLTAQQMIDMVVMAFERLSPDGRLVVSCGAPRQDGPPRPRFNPTLGPDLPAQYVAFACREAGFSTVDVSEWSGDDYLVVATR